MTFFGIPAELSALQATQAQKVASKARARERGMAAEDARRREDAVELGVAGLEDGSAIRKADEDANDEQSSRGRTTPGDSAPADESSEELQGPGGIDLTA